MKGKLGNFKALITLIISYAPSPCPLQAVTECFASSAGVRSSQTAVNPIDLLRALDFFAVPVESWPWGLRILRKAVMQVEQRLGSDGVVASVLKQVKARLEAVDWANNTSTWVDVQEGHVVTKLHLSASFYVYDSGEDATVTTDMSSCTCGYTRCSRVCSLPSYVK